MLSFVTTEVHGNRMPDGSTGKAADLNYVHLSPTQCTMLILFWLFDMEELPALQHSCIKADRTVVWYGFAL